MPDSTPPLSETLRALIESNTKPLAVIARQADVNYRALHRWYTGTTSTLDVDTAEKVYQTLTGKKFVRG